MCALVGASGQDALGNSAILLASASSDPSSAVLLLDAGADTTPNARGETVFTGVVNAALDVRIARSAGDMVKGCWGYAGDMVKGCWGYAGDMLKRCWGYAGDTCWTVFT